MLRTVCAVVLQGDVGKNIKFENNRMTVTGRIPAETEIKLAEIKFKNGENISCANNQFTIDQDNRKSQSRSSTKTDGPLSMDVRQMITQKFRTDEDFEAFCIDHYPDVYRRFTAGMNRTHKVNTLLVLMSDNLVSLTETIKSYPLP